MLTIILETRKKIKKKLNNFYIYSYIPIDSIIPMSVEAESRQLINILLQICSKGCVLENLNVTYITEIEKKYFFPKCMLFRTPIEVAPILEKDIRPENKLHFLPDTILLRGIGESSSYQLWYGPDSGISYPDTNCLNFVIRGEFNLVHKINIYTSPKHILYGTNNERMDEIIRHLYPPSGYTSSPTNSSPARGRLSSPAMLGTKPEIETYRQKLWELMYKECFGFGGLLYLLICDKYLISDIKKLIINSMLNIDKWAILGFYCY